MVFIAQPDIYVTDQQKANYALSHVDQHVLDYFRPFLKSLEDSSASDHDLLANYAMFKETVYHAFGDLNPVYHAEEELSRLKQTGSVAEYTSNFRRIIAALKWNDQAYQSSYRNNLKQFVKNELARKEDQNFASLDDLI